MGLLNYIDVLAMSSSNQWNESNEATLESSQTLQILKAIDEYDLASLSTILSTRPKDGAASLDWTLIVSRAFQRLELLETINCLATFDRVDLVVERKQDDRIPSLLRGNTCLHWLFDWYNLMSTLSFPSLPVDQDKLQHTLEQVFSLLLPLYESKHNLIELDAMSPDPLVVLAVSNPSCFRLFSTLYERYHVSLDRLGSSGVSALHVAIASNEMDSIKFLLKHCPQLVDVKDAQGLSSIEWATSRGISIDTLLE